MIIPPMYATCIFCHSALGSNETIEHFRVGRRLAYDGELALLEQQWKVAEEIAAIADTLALPPSIDRFLRRHREG